MKEETLIKAYYPIIKNLAKQRFMYQLRLCRSVLIKNKGSINLYEAHKRDEKIKIRLAKHKTIKLNDVDSFEYNKIQKVIGCCEQIAQTEDNKRYDFISELILLLERTTIDLTDIDNIIEYPDEIYEDYFEDRYIQMEIKNTKKRVSYLIS